MYISIIMINYDVTRKSHKQTVISTESIAIHGKRDCNDK